MSQNYWMHPSFYSLPNEMENPTQNCRIDTIILIAFFNAQILFFPRANYLACLLSLVPCLCFFVIYCAVNLVFAIIAQN